MMKSYAHLEQKVYSDGKMIENKDIEMNYDGEKLAIDVHADGHKKHMVLSKDDIMKVFSQPMHANNLMTRLKLDFKPTKKRHTKTKKRHTKTKKNHRRKSSTNKKNKA
jgi:hypothetical protein